MTFHQAILAATQCRKDAAECKKAGFNTLARVNLEMAEDIECRASAELLLDNTLEE